MQTAKSCRKLAFGIPILVQSSAALICFLATGCISSKDYHYDQAPSANDIRYHDGFQGLRTPPFETIKKASAGTWQFNQSMTDVWKACLEVASQYQCIVSIQKYPHGRSLCVIKGRDAQLSPSDQVTQTTF